MACVQKQPVPVSVVGFVVAHASYDDGTIFGLLFKVADGFKGPVGVFSVGIRVPFNGYGVCWTECYASHAVHAVLIFAAYGVGFLVVEVGFISALVNAYFAAYATILVTFN